VSKVRNPAAIFEALVERVLRGPGVSPPQQRAAAAGVGADGLPAAAAPVIEKVRSHAYKVTDADIAALKAAGLDEDTIFELTVSAAVGVATRRLYAAMKVISGNEETDAAR
jgi:alkylhydroperoxidase family enzyme